MTPLESHDPLAAVQAYVAETQVLPHSAAGEARRAAARAQLAARVALPELLGLLLANTRREETFRQLEKALAALLEDAGEWWENDELCTIILQGLSHGESSVRKTSLKYAEMIPREAVGREMLASTVGLLQDRDVGLATNAAAFIGRRLREDDDGNRAFLNDEVERLLRLNSDDDVVVLRIWELGAAVFSSSTQRRPLQGVILDMMQEAFLSSTPSSPLTATAQRRRQDVLFMMNALQILRSVSSRAAGGAWLAAMPRADHLFTVLELLASEENSFYDDALRIMGDMAASFSSSSLTSMGDTAHSLPVKFFNIITNRLPRPSHGRLEEIKPRSEDLLAIEVAGRFFGSLGAQEGLFLRREAVVENGMKLWFAHILAQTHSGTEAGRVVAFEALVQALRGGCGSPQLLVSIEHEESTPVSPHALLASETMCRCLTTGLTISSSSATSSALAKELHSAVTSLHPNVQAGAFACCAMLGSQVGPSGWGVRLVYCSFAPLAQALISEKMPSPNASKEAVEWRFAALENARVGEILGSSSDERERGIASAVAALVSRGVFGANARPDGRRPAPDSVPTVEWRGAA